MERFKRRFGDLKIGFGQQRRQLQRVLVVHEAVFGNRVGRQARGQVVVEQQQFAERVPILRHGQAPDQAVLRRRTQAGDFQSVCRSTRRCAGARPPKAAACPSAAWFRRGPGSGWLPILEYGGPRVCASSWSTRMPAVPVSELWQAMQFCLKKGFTYCSNDASSGAGPAAAWASRKRAVTAIPATETKIKANTDCSRIRYLECTDRISNHNTIPLNYA